MRRREFIRLLGGAAAASSAAARAEQAAMPVIGFISSLASRDQASIMTAFRRGLGDAGFTEDRNVAIEYRWADEHCDRVTRADFPTSACVP